jgi:hypothetical protein
MKAGRWLSVQGILLRRSGSIDIFPVLWVKMAANGRDVSAMTVDGVGQSLCLPS